MPFTASLTLFSPARCTMLPVNWPNFSIDLAMTHRICLVTALCTVNNVKWWNINVSIIWSLQRNCYRDTWYSDTRYKLVHTGTLHYSWVVPLTMTKSWIKFLKALSNVWVFETIYKTNSIANNGRQPFRISSFAAMATLLPRNISWPQCGSLHCCFCPTLICKERCQRCQRYLRHLAC